MQTTISFRPLCESDFPLLRSWFAAPHVSEWWHEPLDLAAVSAKYSPRLKGDEPTHVFLIDYGGMPIGWIQWYLWSDYPAHARQLGAELASAGIDLAIGEISKTGLGLGPIAIRAFLGQIVFAVPGVSGVFTDPAVSNVRSLSAFRKAGFAEVRTVQLAGEDFKRRVVSLKRP